MPLDLSKLSKSSPKRSVSMLAGAQPAQQITLETFRIKALLLGHSGSGKSTSAMSLPGRKLVLEADGRSESLAGFPDVEILKLSDWDSVTTVAEELWGLAESSQPFPYSGLIWDGMTALGRLAMQWSLSLTDAKGKQTPRGLGDVPAQQHYLPQMYQFSKLILSVLPLPCHIVFTGHVDIYEDSVLNTIELYPKVTGKARTEVCAWFNETYWCHRKKDAYFWSTKPFGRHSFLKSAMNQLGRYWDGDIPIDFSSPPTGFELLLQQRFSQKGDSPDEQQLTKPDSGKQKA